MSGRSACGNVVAVTVWAGRLERLRKRKAGQRRKMAWRQAQEKGKTECCGAGRLRKRESLPSR